jgi:hypothetical protein
MINRSPFEGLPLFVPNLKCIPDFPLNFEKWATMHSGILTGAWVGPAGAQCRPRTGVNARAFNYAR